MKLTREVTLHRDIAVEHTSKDPDFLPCQEENIPQPAAIKNAEGEVSDIHTASKSSDHHKQKSWKRYIFLTAGGIE